MFPLGIRIWTNKTMIYSNKFEIEGNRETRRGNVIVLVDKKRSESDIYMAITNANCMSGDVYEYDILKGPDGKNSIVYFDTCESKFVGKVLDEQDDYIDIVPEMFSYEIIGNPLENPELLEYCNLEGIPDIERLLQAANRPIDYSQDMLNTVNEDEIDFGETDEEAERDIREDIMRDSFDVSLVLDKSAKIIPMVAGDITDEYVDWVYSFIEGEKKRAMEENNVIDDTVILIYVESEYDQQDKIGAYAYRIEYDGYEIENTGKTTNIHNQNTAELSAVVKSLCTINTPSRIKLISSSKYVVSPFSNGWIYQWEKNNWKKRNSREKVKNSALFSKLLKLTGIHDIEFSLIESIESDEKLLSCKKMAQECMVF